MNDSVVEVLVKRKTPTMLSVGKNILIVLTVLLALPFFMIGNALLLIPALIFGALAYYLYMKCNTEYEYTYFDKEIDVDVIYAMTRRKRVTTFDMTKLEVLAPVNSYHLDDYKRREVKVKDYSSGDSQAKAYAMFLGGNEKIIFEPSEKMVKAIANIAPRKVFTE